MTGFWTGFALGGCVVAAVGTIVFLVLLVRTRLDPDSFDDVEDFDDDCVGPAMHHVQRRAAAERDGLDQGE